MMQPVAHTLSLLLVLLIPLALLGCGGQAQEEKQNKKLQVLPHKVREGKAFSEPHAQRSEASGDVHSNAEVTRQDKLNQLAEDLESSMAEREALKKASRQACVQYYDQQARSDALEPCQQASDLGDAQSQYLLSEILFDKSDLAKQSDSLRLLHSSAEQGYAEALYRLGTYHAEGRFLRKDDELSIANFTSACKKELGEACNRLGEALLDQKKFSDAVKQFERAKQFGSMFVFRNLAYIYEKGLGVDVSLATAYDYYHQSAMLGNSASQYRLFWQYYKGIETEKKDYGEAYIWLLVSQKFVDITDQSKVQTNRSQMDSDIPTQTRLKIEKLVSREQKREAKLRAEALIREIKQNIHQHRIDHLYARE